MARKEEVHLVGTTGVELVAEAPVVDVRVVMMAAMVRVVESMVVAKEAAELEADVMGADEGVAEQTGVHLVVLKAREEEQQEAEGRAWVVMEVVGMLAAAGAVPKVADMAEEEAAQEAAKAAATAVAGMAEVERVLGV